MSYVVAKLLLGIGIWQFGVMGADQTIGTHEAPLMEVETCYLNLWDMHGIFPNISPYQLVQLLFFQILT